MSTDNRLSRVRIGPPEHEEECLCWDTDGRVDICRYIDDSMWVNRDFEVVDVAAWRDLEELAPE